MNLTGWLDSLRRDARDARRLLRRNPAFTAAAVLTLAVGIAGTTVMFALVRGVLLRPLPVRDQGALILAWKEVPTSGSARYPFGNTEIAAVARESQLLEQAAGVTRNGVARTVVTDGDAATYVNVALVTGGFFDVLGVTPVLGRTLAPADDVDGSEPVVVISSGLWRRQYGAVHDIVGRRIAIGEQPFTIVGVMPPDLDYPSGVEIWRPASSVPVGGPFGDAARREVNLVGRLRPGVTVAQAASEIAALSPRIDAGTTGMRGLVPVVRPFIDMVIGDIRTSMVAMFAAVGLVLLIASANVANLLLMRGEARRGELALRAAVGADRADIVRQVFVESAMLASLAGIAGFLLARISLAAAIALVPDGLPRVEAIHLDLVVVGFAVAASLVCAVLAALTPAVFAARADLISPLRGSAQGLTRGGAARGRRTLVVAQVALAVTVLAVAGLLVRSVINLQAIDLGLAPDRLVLLELHLPASRYADRAERARFLDGAIAELEDLPGGARVTPVNISPFSDRGWDVPRLAAEGQTADESAANPSLNLESIHANYFATFDIPIVRGRAFTNGDREGSVAVAIVSEDAAAQIWPQQDPIGKRVKMGTTTSRAGWLEVVGVAAATRYRTVTAARPTLYLPAAQFQMTASMLAVRTTAPVELVTSVAGERLQRIDRSVRVMSVRPFVDLLDRPLARPRFAAFVLGVFATVALLLATIGLYAVVSASARQRTRELAIRLALGATPQSVRRLVLLDAVRMAALGSGLGVAAAVVVSRTLRGMLFGVSPLDPLSLGAAALLLLAAAALASSVPVRRAARADLVAALRGGG